MTSVAHGSPASRMMKGMTSKADTLPAALVAHPAPFSTPSSFRTCGSLPYCAECARAMDRRGRRCSQASASLSRRSRSSRSWAALAVTTRDLGARLEDARNARVFADTYHRQDEQITEMLDATGADIVLTEARSGFRGGSRMLTEE